MGRIDLHLHTTYSDGTATPAAVATQAAARRVGLIAITDHDETAGIIEAQQAGQALGVTVISGVEINTDSGHEEIHILGYGFPIGSPILAEGLQALRASRLERAAKIVERLNALGYPLKLDRVLAIAGSGSVGRPHIARALVQEGFARSSSDAFSNLIGRGCPAHISRKPFTAEDAIALIHRAGGITSLAHPGKLGDPARVVRELQPAGLDALEAYHSDHSAGAVKRLLQIAADARLLVTGGTDSHGPGSPRVVAIGSLDIPESVGEQLLARLNADLRHEKVIPPLGARNPGLGTDTHVV